MAPYDNQRPGKGQPQARQGYPPTEPMSRPPRPESRQRPNPYGSQGANQPRRPARRQPVRRPQYYVPPPPPPRPPVPPPSAGSRKGSTALISILVVVSLFVIGLCLVVAAYAAIASDLPSPEALRGQSASFVSTQIYDRNGHLLHEIVDPSGGRRILIPLEQISPYLINGTVATEDERFWQHPGVDPIAFLRAVWYNLRE